MQGTGASEAVTPTAGRTQLSHHAAGSLPEGVGPAAPWRQGLDGGSCRCGLESHAPRSQEAPTGDNGIWWDRNKNRDLGQRRMSRLDILDAKRSLLIKGVRAALALAAKPLLTTAMASVVIVCVLSVLELGLRHYQGDISREEFAVGVIRATTAAGAGSFIVTGLLMGLALAFPVLLPLLQAATIPLAVVGFVFLTNEVMDLGDEWWAALDEQGICPSSFWICGPQRSFWANCRFGEPAEII